MAKLVAAALPELVAFTSIQLTPEINQLLEGCVSVITIAVLLAVACISVSATVDVKRSLFVTVIVLVLVGPPLVAVKPKLKELPLTNLAIFLILNLAASSSVIEI